MLTRRSALSPDLLMIISPVTLITIEHFVRIEKYLVALVSV